MTWTDAFGFLLMAMIVNPVSWLVFPGLALCLIYRPLRHLLITTIILLATLAGAIYWAFL